MDGEELAWLGLWTLIAYAPAAFEKLRQLPGSEAITDAALGRARVGPNARQRVQDATREGGFDVLAERGLRAIASAGEGAGVIRAEEVPGSSEVSGGPPWFWVRGNRRLLEGEARACVVGSRRADAAGTGMTRDIVGALAREGWTIVSGGALGIDAAAHRAALEARTPTVVVLPSGLDRAYPLRHAKLFDDVIREGGLLLTPFPPGHPPQRWHFARRNLVMAAMSAATVVVRASPASGSLITARAALGMGRRVLAVPGDAWRRELRGTNELLLEGAELLADPAAPGLVRELSRHPEPRAGQAAPGVATEPSRRSERPASVAALNRPERPAHSAQASLTQGARRVLRALTSGPLHGDDLATRTGAPLHTLHATLLDLELAEWIHRQPGGIYALTSRGAAV